MTTAIFFPNQLFDLPHVRALVKKHANIHTILVWEDPAFFGIRDGETGYPSRIPLNRLRLAYQYVADRLFADRVRAAFGAKIKVTVVPMHEAKKPPAGPVVFYDPCDLLISRKFATAAIETSPQFILTADECVAYAKGKKRLMHRPFFDYVKMRMGGFLEGVASTDEANRASIPASEAAAAPPPYVQLRTAPPIAKLWADAYNFVDKEFPNAPGGPPLHTPPPLPLPLTPSEAIAWFKKFIKERMSKFAMYEDAIASGQPWLYHSGISIFLNNGLLTPADVRKNLPANSPSLEAFARQVFGWREYARMYYLTVPHNIARKNVFKHKAAALSQNWYKAQSQPSSFPPVVQEAVKPSSFPPVVQEAVNDAWNMGYLHHIRRLMVVSNYMTLHGTHPDEVYKWMFAFALDAWPWVMVFNVYSMGTWSDGGLAMRKPYISSSSYIRRMARLSASRQQWAEDWDADYAAFLKKNKTALQHTILARGRAQ